MSTLPPPPTVNTTVPIIGPESGKESSYSDPNSSASIMKNVAQLNAQSEADTKFDINQDIYEKKEKESFIGSSITYPFLVDILFFFTVLLTLTLFLIPHPPYGKAYIILLSLSLLTIYLLLKKNYV